MRPLLWTRSGQLDSAGGSEVKNRSDRKWTKETVIQEQSICDLINQNILNPGVNKP